MTDEQGNVLLGWYDRRDSNDPSSTNVDYRPYVAYVTSAGSTILGPSAISNISSRVSTFDPGSGQWIYNYFPGDYHEIWRHNYPDGARWNDVWIARVLNTNGDLYVTDVR